jgi:DNA-binding protein H-NS
MIDIIAYLDVLKQKLEQAFETETPDRKAAREKAIKKMMAAIGEFNTLSQKVGTTPDQMAAISQLQQVLFNLGEIKSPEK